jgi:Mg-chelatase subunit ChlD
MPRKSKPSAIPSPFDATASVRPGRSARPGRTADARAAEEAPGPARAARPASPVDFTRALAAAAIALSLGVAAVVLGWWHSLPARPYHLPAPVGRRTLNQPLAIELVIDQSGSNSTSDPHNLRVSESAEVLRWLARYARPTDRIGVVQFSSTPVTTLPLTRVQEAARKAGAVTTPDPRVAGGGTDIASALALGISNLASATPRSRRMLILFTDGASDTETSIPPMLARATGINVFMVALDADGTYDQSAHFWEDLHLSGISRIHSANRGTVARPIAEAVLKETGQHLPR